MTARLAALGVVACLAGLAGAAFHRGFGLGAVLGPVVAAAVIPVVLAALLARGGRRPPPLPVSFLSSAVLWLAVVAATLFRDGSPHARGVLPAVADGLVNGSTRLLDTTLPAPDSPDLLVVPQALTWLAALAGAELVLRTRSVLAPALPALVAFGVAVTVTVSGPGSNLGIAGGLVVAAGALALCRRAEPRAPSDHGRPTWPESAGRIDARRSTLGLTVVAATAAVALAAGPALLVPSAGPYDLRAHRSVPSHPQPTVSPLDFVSAWLRSPGEALFTAAPPVSRNIRLAALDRFDGQQWTPSARFTPAGGRVPPAPGGPPAADRISQDITIGTLPGVFLPHVDRPVTLTGADLAVDTAGGSLISSSPLVPGRAYRVTSAVPRDLSPQQLAALRIASGTSSDAARTLPPGLPAPIAAAAREVAAAGGTPFQRAYRLEQFLRTRFTYDPEAPSGHAYGHLAYFLDRSHTGTSEQFATAFAVLARVLGLPSRVVVGFHPAGLPATGAAPVGTDRTKNDRTGAGRTGVVRAGDVLVWPEIDFAGAGWVPFYPTPQAAGPHGGSVATSAQGEPAGRAEQVTEAAAVPPQSVVQSAPAGSRSSSTPVGALAGLALAGAVVIAGVAYVVLGLSAPARRRRRRRAADGDRERVVGAWLDTLESLDRAGAPVPPSATPTDVVDLGSALVGPGGRAPLTALARLATAALHGPDIPGAPSAVSGREAEAAWQHSATMRTELRRVTPRSRRARRCLAPAAVFGSAHRIEPR
ncbi:Transglutaminase-like superfamily protein [Frankia torreyi]|uniref:Transglutaminase-like superfamily protein n=1 Tax=Frankia torreyi TaxID=1856 RepID=A0A0D8BAB4_9ACTN|nr:MULTISPECIES: transglutaminase domain-containing protein [Frankia]KJE20884.1 Transglutaminase-like superfamily protein [Frankia torreyi]KQM01910.1 Transglutaminase-like superfamily protein [Frankia sp. CpI1-P]